MCGTMRHYHKPIRLLSDDISNVFTINIYPDFGIRH